MARDTFLPLGRQLSFGAACLFGILAAAPAGHPATCLEGGLLAPVMTDDGVLFRHRAEEAQSVAVLGDFNDWDEQANPLRKSRRGVWRATVPLPDGRWSYLYAVDGVWVLDSHNPLSEEVPAEIAEEVSARTEWGDAEASLLKIKRNVIVLPRSPGSREADSRLRVTYERVNQISLHGGLAYQNTAELHPILDIMAGYSFGRERWLYEIGITQPLFDFDLFELGARVYRRNATADDHRIGEEENSLAAFFFREDWRDYYEAEGYGAHATLHLTLAQELSLRWRAEDHRAVVKTTDWGLFGGDKLMRSNPAIHEGELRGLAVAYGLDTRNNRDNPSRGHLAAASYEWVGDSFGGAFTFRRAGVDLRRYQKISRGHYFDVRITAGHIDSARRGRGAREIAGHAAIPAQERLYLGGIGTMRATNFKSLQGDRMVLVNAEVRVEILDDLQVALFTDVGDAWIAVDEELDLHTDAGIGFQDADGSIRVNFARKMDRESDGDVFVSVRIQRMF